MINTEEIKKLRIATGAGVISCKKALEEARGDFARAKEILKKDFEIVAQKKAERTTGQGIIEAYVHGQKIGVLLELNSETDFVSRNKVFQDLAHELVMQIASMKPANLGELLAQPYIRDEKILIKDLITQKQAIIGENIRLKRFVRFELGEN